MVGNESLFITLLDTAIRNVDGTSTYFSLEHRHPDGEQWLEVGRFPSRKVAQMALDAFVAHDQVGQGRVPRQEGRDRGLTER